MGRQINPGEQHSFDPGAPAGKECGYPRPFVFDDSVAASCTPERDNDSTDTWTDWTLRWYEGGQRPFWLHISNQAPHDFLRTPLETIEKYEEKYDGGYGADWRRPHRFDDAVALLGLDWVNISNTLFRYYKNYSYQGCGGRPTTGGRAGSNGGCTTFWRTVPKRGIAPRLVPSLWRNCRPGGRRARGHDWYHRPETQ